VGARLRAVRERRGLPRRTLGTAAGTSGTNILNIEDGRTIPRLDLVERLAVALDVAPCWLAFGAPPER
jgi:transcriptional regulator with XRE-family HTH domain